MTGVHGMNSGNERWDADLCPADRAALDALADAGYDLGRVEAGHRERAARLLHAMGALECAANGGCGCESLVRLCLGRAALARVADEAPELSPQDEDALESLVQHGFEPRRVPSAVRERAARQAGLLAVLQAASEERVERDGVGREGLIRRTLVMVQAEIETQERVMRVASRPAAAGRRWRIPDLVSVAAMLLIGVSVAWPVMSAVRERSRMVMNQSNLRTIGMGMGMYSGSSDGALPMATASLAGTPWWFVGRAEQSNSANLYTLVREGYTCPSAFAAPGNRAASECHMDPASWDWKSLQEVPYSYQNQFARRRPVWRQSGDMIVLADRSPVILKAYQGQWVDPLENSPNSAGRGQHALMLDGAVAWMTSPVTAKGDNIWLPRPIEEAIRRATNQRRAEPLQGTEQPEGESDAFLVP